MIKRVNEINTARTNSECDEIPKSLLKKFKIYEQGSLITAAYNIELELNYFYPNSEIAIWVYWDNPNIELVVECQSESLVKNIKQRCKKYLTYSSWSLVYGNFQNLVFHIPKSLI